MICIINRLLPVRGSPAHAELLKISRRGLVKYSTIIWSSGATGAGGYNIYKDRDMAGFGVELILVLFSLFMLLGTIIT